MTKLPLWQFAVLALLIALCASAQPAFAQDVPHHWQIKSMPHNSHRTGAAPETGAAPKAGLYGTTQAFVVTPLNQPIGTTTNTAELWPCFGGSGSAQPDCAFIGSTGTSDPASLAGSAVLGIPHYVWYLSADSVDGPWQPFGCAATTTADTLNFCGQTNTFYEDWSGDAADELTYLITTTQGTTTLSYIADSGTVDFGPNPFGGAVPANDVVIFGDQNFGTDGVPGGPNNGNCSADFNYPIPGGNFAAITSISESSTTVTATITSGTGSSLKVGDFVFVTGTSSAKYNGELVSLTGVTATSLTWTDASGKGSATKGQAILYFDGTSFFYPLVIAGGKTCVNPIAGAAKLTAITAVEKATYTKQTSGTVCTNPGGAPCYTVTYSAPKKATQTWSIFFR